MLRGGAENWQGQKKSRIIKRLEVVEAFRNSGQQARNG
jgi:hypothetical protein